MEEERILVKLEELTQTVAELAEQGRPQPVGRAPYVFEKATDVPWPAYDAAAEREAAIKARDARIALAEANAHPPVQQHPYVFQGPNDVPFTSAPGEDLTPAEARKRAEERGAAALARQDAQRGTRGE